MTEVILNGTKLHAIAHASPTAEIVMTQLAIRDRIRTFSDIVRTRTELVRAGEKIVEADYLAIWKGLQDAGMGTIVYARKGKPAKFQWHYSMKKVASVALTGKDEKADRSAGAPIKTPSPKQIQYRAVKDKRARLISKPKKAIKEIPAIAQPAPTALLKSVCLALRPGLNIEIRVPLDFSKKEADFIGNALKNFSI